MFLINDYCFRPLIGVIISNQIIDELIVLTGKLVSVPLSGLSFLIKLANNKKLAWYEVSVPLSGLSFLIYKEGGIFIKEIARMFPSPYRGYHF